MKSIQMAANTAAVDVIVDTDGLDVPSCPHGPAFLFTRFSQDENQKEKRFFACSAFRDRKKCSFYQDADVKRTQCKYIEESFLPRYSHEEFWKRYQTIKGKANSDRAWCRTCELLLLPGEIGEHKGHLLKRGLTLDALNNPSNLFMPIEDSKTFAQYLFASSSVLFTIKTLQHLKITHVLCVGAPRIHEALRKQTGDSGKIKSLLMDLDHRHMQMCSPSEFCHFNMFNFHFFRSGHSTYKEFVSPKPGKRVAIVTDPPFGGLVEPLIATFKRMLEDSSPEDRDEKTSDGVTSVVPLIWFFPYFFEKRITDMMSSLHMLDYKVDYDNHTLFSKKKSKKGSPVRIFTNVPPKLIPLPTEEGYRWCEICERYSARENKHCTKCGLCTSKDGSSYVHCDACERCVKPSWVHCKRCGRCQLQDHKCGTVLGSGCHICGDKDHKRRDCPKRVQQNRKRKHNGFEKTEGPSAPKKKKKKKRK